MFLDSNDPHSYSNKKDNFLLKDLFVNHYPWDSRVDQQDISFKISSISAAAVRPTKLI